MTKLDSTCWPILLMRLAGSGFVGLLLAVFASLALHDLSVSEGRQEVQQDAVANRVAEFRCDPMTGEVTFAWITPEGQNAEAEVTEPQ